MKINFFKVTVKTKLLDKIQIMKNKKNLLSENKIVDLPSHTIDINRYRWQNYNWSEFGEEWTESAKLYKGIDPQKWKQSLINNLMLKNFEKDRIIVEIGSGAGRWTEHLQKIAKKIIVTDITQKSIEICKKRFELKNNVEYKIIKNGLDFIDDNYIEYVWSYDVFVHINPSDVENYVKDLSRILKPNGLAIIHHSGSFASYKDRSAWRAYLGKKQFANFIDKYGMKIIEQNESLVHLEGDVITIFSKPP